MLVDVHRQLGSRPGALQVTGASPTLERLLEVTGLDEHFTPGPAGSAG